jgi:hypothetical protein
LVLPTTVAQALVAKRSGDAQQRFTIDSDGKMSWGPGSGALDTFLKRVGGTLCSDGDFEVGDPSGSNTRAIYLSLADSATSATGNGQTALSLKTNQPGKGLALDRVVLGTNGAVPSGFIPLCVAAR